MPTITPAVQLGDLSRRQRIELILITTSTRHIDALEREFVGQVHLIPLLRHALFETARQQAAYRSQQVLVKSVHKPISERDAYSIHALKAPVLINLLLTTTDIRVVDEIEECTIERLSYLPTIRKALFTVARAAAQSRAEQLQPACSPSLTA